MQTENIQNIIDGLKKNEMLETGRLSDGHHTFDELYYHRMILFLTVMKIHRDKSWVSKLHHDGTMYDNYFIAGIETPEGQYSYHYHMEYWDCFKDINELKMAPEYDGHKPEDIDRLLSLLKHGWFDNDSCDR